MKAKVYTVKGVAKEDITLPKEYKAVSNSSLLAQAVRVYEDRTHFGLNRVKTRSEINATKKKLYKQKGTGGARHGAKSAHIFVGGGVAHGPTGMKRDLKMPVKMKKKALLVALSNKFADKKAVLVEGINKISKTSEAFKALEAIKKVLEIKAKTLLVLANNDAKYFKFFANVKNLEVVKFSDLNAFLVLKRSLVLVDSSVFNVQKETESKVKSSKKK